MRPLEEARADAGYTAQDRVADGCLCFGVKKEQKVIAYTWCDLKVCNHKPLPISLESSEAYLIRYVYVRRMSEAIISPRLCDISSTRILSRWVVPIFFSVTDAFNSASKRFKGKLGAYRLKLYLYIKFGKLFERNFLLKSYE